MLQIFSLVFHYHEQPERGPAGVGSLFRGARLERPQLFQVPESVGEARVDFDSLAESRLGLGQPACRAKESSKIIPGPFVVRPFCEQFPIDSFGLVCAAKPLERIGQVIHGVDAVGIELDGGAKPFGRLNFAARSR